MKNVLILCTGNSCRSIIAEAILNKELNCCVKAYSAGVSAKGEIHPSAIRVLLENDHDTGHLKSKNLDALDGIDFDLVVTVCDHAKESCPMFPGKVQKLHVGFPDPDGQEYEAFVKTYEDIKTELVPAVKSALSEKDCC